MRTTPLFLVCMLSDLSAASAEDKAAAEIPKDVVVAWKKLTGVESGHLNAGPQSVPGFTVKFWRKGLLSKAPAPEQPFGLQLRSSSITDAGLRELAGLKKLSYLDLSRNKISDEGLKELAQFKQLFSLNLAETQITDAGMKELAGLKQLAWLDLSNTKVTHAGLKELADLPLGFVGLDSKQVSDDVLKVMHATGKLHALSATYGAKPEDVRFVNLALTPVTDEGLKELVDLKNITRIDLSEKITDGGLKELAGFKELTLIQMQFAHGVKGPGLKHLAALPKLESLQVGGIRDEKLKALCEVGLLHKTYHALAVDNKRPARMDDIVSLSLINMGITDESLKHLTKVPNLAKLQLNGTRITDAGMKELAALPKLASLDLMGTKTSDAGLKDLAGCKELTRLCMGLNMTNAAFKELANFKKLTSLKVSTNRVNNEGLKDLAALKNLTTIEFFGGNVTKSAVEDLRKALPNCKISGTIRRDP